MRKHLHHCRCSIDTVGILKNPICGNLQASNGAWAKKTPFDHPLDFNRNSPLNSVKNLKIPLLIWSGKQDTQVDLHQSLEYYLALRRLGKKSIMLLYPKEGHTLLNPTHQKDLSQRVLQWFDYFLKDDQCATWINNGIR